MRRPHASTTLLGCKTKGEAQHFRLVGHSNAQQESSWFEGGSQDAISSLQLPWVSPIQELAQLLLKNILISVQILKREKRSWRNVHGICKSDYQFKRRLLFPTFNPAQVLGPSPGFLSQLTKSQTIRLPDAPQKMAELFCLSHGRTSGKIAVKAKSENALSGEYFVDKVIY